MKSVKCVYWLLLMVVIQRISADISYQEFLQNVNATTKTRLSQDCQEDLNLISFSTTYLLLVDSSSRIPSGLAKGNVISMGNYDECLEIEEVETKFCQATLKVSLPNLDTILPSLKRVNTELVGVSPKSLDVRLSYCVVKSCSEQDLNIIFNRFVEFDESQCLSKEPEAFDSLSIFAMTIFSLIALLVVSSTVYGIFLCYTERESIHPLATSFSLYDNGKKLFHLGSSEQLQCLNGIKSLSMMWVVMGHVFMAYVFVPLDNYVDVYKWMDSTYSQYISGATVSVDTFFVVGGFLTIYTFQATMDKGIKFNVPLYYIHRYLRLTPALAAMVLAHVALFNYFGSGPIWNRTDAFLAQPCRLNWWSALLYVQNYANPEGSCVPQSWYLSVDMQLFVISPIVLILMRQWPFWGYLSLSLTSLLSIFGSFLLGWFYNLGGQMTSNTDGNLQDYMAYYYMPTHTRMPPYLFGIMLGHLIYEARTAKREIQIKNFVVLLFWILSLGLMATCLYGGHTLQFAEYDRLANSVYLALMRPTWAICICWVIFACVMDYGGPINTFLSLPAFRIVSRLSYSIYLVHYSFIFMTNFTARSPQHFSDYNAFHKFLGDFTFSFVIAVLWTLVFESPVIVLEKYLLGSRRKTDSGGTTKIPIV